VALAVRLAREADAGGVVRIYVASWLAGFGSRMPEIAADAERTERWRVALAAARPPERWWVAERDGAVVGFAGVCACRDPVDERLGELDTIAVDPPAWRTGVGRALLAEAVAALAVHGYADAVLWTLAAYPLGESFYRAGGFAPTGRVRQEGRQIQYGLRLRAGA
jgi:N-acetylglutamate synthase-like GNAT family acetyltransferase